MKTPLKLIRRSREARLAALIKLAKPKPAPAKPQAASQV